MDCKKGRQRFHGFENKDNDSNDKKGTVKCHLTTLNHFGDFVGSIGDCGTVFMCDHEVYPANPHPANPVTIIMHCNWKANHGTEVLKDPITDQNVKDTLGHMMFCTGDWNLSPGMDKAMEHFECYLMFISHVIVVFVWNLAKNVSS